MSEVEYRLRNYNILFNGANTINKKMTRHLAKYKFSLVSGLIMK